MTNRNDLEHRGRVRRVQTEQELIGIADPFAKWIRIRCSLGAAGAVEIIGLPGNEWIGWRHNADHKIHLAEHVRGDRVREIRVWCGANRQPYVRQRSPIREQRVCSSGEATT